jgi:diguanylate cyclase (GGDEF)-like protein
MAVAARVLILARRMPHLLGIADGSGRLVWLNDAGRRFVGADPEATVTTADLFTEDVLERYRASIRPVLVEHGIWTGELPLRRADGTTGVVDAVLVGDADPSGQVRWFGCLAFDVSEQHEREETLSHRALHDPLTGLPNRSLLDDRLRVAVSVAARSGSPVAVLALDLDGFKAVNDHHGHAVGDQLLQQVTARIQAAVRPADTVARLGGDEFVIVVHPPEDPAAAMVVAERVRDQIGLVDYLVGPHHLRVTASIGLAMSEVGRPVTPEALLHAADRGMYRAKQAGGNQIRAAAADRPGRVEALDRVGGELARALAEGRIVAAFDPVVDLGDGQVCAVQALARWDRPGRGLVPARHFVEEATLTGHADLVWWAAARDAVRVAGEVGVEVAVHIPLSTSQLRNPDLLERLTALRSLGPRLDLHLKVDAHSVLELATVSRDVLSEVADEDFRLVLAGHGEHNLPSPILDALPLSAVQLAHEVVERARHQPRAVALATRVPAALGAPCIARVEREADLAMLAVLGITAASGRAVGAGWDAAALAAAARATQPRPSPSR